MPSTDFSKQISERIVCRGRPRQTLQAILAQACANNTHHVPYSLKSIHGYKSEAASCYWQQLSTSKHDWKDNSTTDNHAESGNDRISITKVM